MIVQVWQDSVADGIVRMKEGSRVWQQVVNTMTAPPGVHGVWRTKRAAGMAPVPKQTGFGIFVLERNMHRVFGSAAGAD